MFELWSSLIRHSSRAPCSYWQQRRGCRDRLKLCNNGSLRIWAVPSSSRTSLSRLADLFLSLSQLSMKSSSWGGWAVSCSRFRWFLVSDRCVDVKWPCLAPFAIASMTRQICFSVQLAGQIHRVRFYYLLVCRVSFIEKRLVTTGISKVYETITLQTKPRSPDCCAVVMYRSYLG